MTKIKTVISKLNKTRFSAQQDWSGSWFVALHGRAKIVSNVPEEVAVNLQHDLNTALESCERALERVGAEISPLQENLNI